MYLLGAWYNWLPSVLNVVLLLLGLFLILIVLIQRGKGGGLAGAFGGVGGSSAFGSRAGDLFTKVTLIVAGIWIVLTMIQVRVVRYSSNVQNGTETQATQSEAPGP